MAAVAGCLPGAGMTRPDYASKEWLARPLPSLLPYAGLLLAWWALVLVCVDTTGGAS
jgi:hypothetical protein